MIFPWAFEQPSMGLDLGPKEVKEQRGLNLKLIEIREHLKHQKWEKI